MKILHIGYSDKLGGAAIAMMRLHKAMRISGINSQVLVGDKLSDDEHVIGPKSDYEKYINELKIKIVRQKKYFYTHDGKYSHSLNLLKSKLDSKIKKINPDIINLHWINNEFISIKEISKLKIPIIWTFNDMWPMCGGEHYVEDDRFILGYDKTQKRLDEKSFDLNKYIWLKKKKYWKSKIQHVVCISNWLKKKAQQSDLFKNHNTSFIPCVINSKDWIQSDKFDAKEKLNLPKNKKILLFMSTNGVKDQRKGFKFIKSYFDHMSKFRSDILLLNVGNNIDINVEGSNIMNINKIFNGDPNNLKLYYSASDVLLAPSILEAFGQVATEAASCGIPSVGFDNTGLEDTILHKKTGYIAKYLSQDDFNNGLNWILEKIGKDRNYFKAHCINFVKDNFSSEIITKKYIDIYKNVLNNENFK